MKINFLELMNISIIKKEDIQSKYQTLKELKY